LVDYSFKKPVKEILDELAATTSRNEKEEILRRERKHYILKMVIYYALDSMIVYHIKKIPEYNPQEVGLQPLNHALDKLYLLSERKKTGYEAQRWLSGLLETLNKDDAEVLERVIKKDLRCGVQAKTVNKVWPGLVSEFEVMLASKLNDKALENINYPAIVEEKLDGMRVNFIIHNGKLDIRTRNGKPLDKLVLYFKKFLNMKLLNNVVLDGELLALKDGKPLPRKKGNGLLNKAQKDTISDDEIEYLSVFLWDMIPLEKFKAGLFEIPYYRRRQELKKWVEFNSVVHWVSQKEVESFYEAKKEFLKVVDRGGEGIILKNRDHLWQNKRSRDLIKMKVENTADLKIVDVIEGEGKYEGMLGSFLFESEDGKLQVNVGSGFSDEQREKFFTNKMIGKIGEVKYNEVIEKENEYVKSLYLPIFSQIREDKDHANRLKEL